MQQAKGSPQIRCNGQASSSSKQDASSWAINVQILRQKEVREKQECKRKIVHTSEDTVWTETSPAMESGNLPGKLQMKVRSP